MSDVETAVVAEVSAEMAQVISWQEQVTDLFETLYDPIMLGTWTSYDLATQLAFREMLDDAYSAFGIVFRQGFDSKVWEGQRNGTVSEEVQSLRKERKDDSAEVKAPPTPAEILAKAKARR